jgi:hypothetical protein
MAWRRLVLRGGLQSRTARAGGDKRPILIATEERAASRQLVYDLSKFFRPESCSDWNAWLIRPPNTLGRDG